MSEVIYENPAAPLPQWARWMAKDESGYVWVYDEKPVQIPDGWDASVVGEDADEEVDHEIDGDWQDSLRRIIRLSEPQYYAPENPHTDEGRLPHDGGPMPEWCRGRLVQTCWRDGGRNDGAYPADGYRWTHRNDIDDIIAYRIVGDHSGEQGRQVPPHRSGGGCPPLQPDTSGVSREVMVDRLRADDGSEDREAGEPDPPIHRNPIHPTEEYGPGLTQADYAAIHLGVPVPGMSEWLRGPLREARRARYREAVIIGSGAVPIESSRGVEALRIVDAMLDQEND